MRVLSGWALPATATGVALASALVAVSHDAAGACVIVTPPYWARLDTVSYVVLRAGSDTLPATTWRPPMRRLGRPPQAPDPPPAPERVVYGQHVEILRAVGPAADSLAALGRHDSTALIAWRMDSMCSLVPPDSTLFLLPGDEAFLAAAPRRDPRAPFRTVILDKSAGRRFYAPAMERDRHPRDWKRLWRRPPVLSAEEFEVFYQGMPPASLWDADPTQALAHLERWATTHPRLARREPAQSLLKAARIAEQELTHPDQAHN